MTSRRTSSPVVTVSSDLAADEQRDREPAAALEQPVDEKPEQQAGHEPGHRPGRGQGDPTYLLGLLDAGKQAEAVQCPAGEHARGRPRAEQDRAGPHVRGR